MIDALSALRPADGLSATGSVAGSAFRSPPAGGADFGQVFAEIASSAVGTMKAGEAAAISGVEGKASVQQVVQAIMSAEETLQAALAVRDKIVAAYQEVSRMAI